MPTVRWNIAVLLDTGQTLRLFLAIQSSGCTRSLTPTAFCAEVLT